MISRVCYQRTDGRGADWNEQAKQHTQAIYKGENLAFRCRRRLRCLWSYKFIDEHKSERAERDPNGCVALSRSNTLAVVGESEAAAGPPSLSGLTAQRERSQSHSLCTQSRALSPGWGTHSFARSPVCDHSAACFLAPQRHSLVSRDGGRSCCWHTNTMQAHNWMLLLPPTRHWPVCVCVRECESGRHREGREASVSREKCTHSLISESLSLSLVSLHTMWLENFVVQTARAGS